MLLSLWVVPMTAPRVRACAYRCKQLEGAGKIFLRLLDHPLSGIVHTGRDEDNSLAYKDGEERTTSNCSRLLVHDDVLFDHVFRSK